jgi:hypothetical protein
MRLLLAVINIDYQVLRKSAENSNGGVELMRFLEQKSVKPFIYSNKEVVGVVGIV